MAFPNKLTIGTVIIGLIAGSQYFEKIDVKKWPAYVLEWINKESDKSMSTKVELKVPNPKSGSDKKDEPEFIKTNCEAKVCYLRENTFLLQFRLPTNEIKYVLAENCNERRFDGGYIYECQTNKGVVYVVKLKNGKLGFFKDESKALSLVGGKTQ
jgi:hypothetical protein